MTQKEVSLGPPFQVNGGQAPGSLTEGVGTEKRLSWFQRFKSDFKKCKQTAPLPKREKIRSTI